ncbi:DUF6308 family protein [Streptomyces californicus]|uniref:DUF6308 family protein n=1 Tax=Streptomyces californicus TaxID=67351 RepID=UPI0037B93019
MPDPRPLLTRHRNVGALHHRLLDLRQAAGLPQTVSALRVADVGIWMAHPAPGYRCP